MADTETLWCVHVIGPDDVCAAPDFDTAERWAVNQNATMRAYTIARRMENDPYWPDVRSVVALWPGDASGHAADLPKSLAEFSKSNAPIVLASGMSASGQDARRLEAKPASPTGEAGDAQ